MAHTGPNKKSYLKESIKKKKRFYPFTLEKKKKDAREKFKRKREEAILSIHIREKKKKKTWGRILGGKKSNFIHSRKEKKEKEKRHTENLENPNAFHIRFSGVRF